MALRVNKMAPTAMPLPSRAVGRPTIRWKDGGGRVRAAVADRGAAGLAMHNAMHARYPVKYQGRQNYQGYYWFAALENHVWYESMNEFSSLMLLDHLGGIVAVASQPMIMNFSDGTWHYPDYFALHADGTQVVYDVKAEKDIDDKVAAQFEKSARFCERCGWGYEVLHGVRGVPGWNLEWIAAYRHNRYSPDAELLNSILGRLDDRTTLGELARTVGMGRRFLRIHNIYNAMWRRHIAFDETTPLDWSSKVWKAEK